MAFKLLISVGFRQQMSRGSRPSVTFALTALCVLMFEGAAEAKATYVTLNVASVESINATNTVTGKYDNGMGGESFERDSDGTITPFAVPNAISTEAMSVNDGNIIAETYYDSSDIAHGFVRAGDGTITTFDVSGASETFPWSINSRAEVTGYCTDSAGDHHGFLRGAGGTVTTFDVTNARDTDPRGINRKGEITGSYTDSNGAGHGFIRATDGTFTTIDVPDATGTVASAIDVKGTVTGSYVESNGDQNGFVRTPDGTITTFAVSGCYLDPAGINRRGEIAGWCYQIKGHHFRQRFIGFIREPDGTVRQFHAPDGGGNTQPFAINDSGVIVGDYSDGGFLRIP